MGTLAQKLAYTVKSVNDITKALEEKGFNMSNVELYRYGELIRLIKGNSSGDNPNVENKSLISGVELDKAVFLSNKMYCFNSQDLKLNGIITQKEVLVTSDKVTQKLKEQTLFNSIKVTASNRKLTNVCLTQKEVLVSNIQDLEKKQEDN